MRRWPGFVLSAVLIASTSTAFAVSQAEKFGVGVTARRATAIADLYETPQKFVGRTIRVDGVVTAVCEEMGCWMSIAPADQPERTVRLKVDHSGGIVFPLKAKGMTASAEGVFEQIAAGDHEARQAAVEQLGAANDEAFGKRYQLKVTGAVISGK